MENTISGRLKCISMAGQALRRKESDKIWISVLLMKDNYFEDVLFVFNSRANAETCSGYSL